MPTNDELIAISQAHATRQALELVNREAQSAAEEYRQQIEAGDRDDDGRYVS